MQVKSRHHLRADEVDRLTTSLATTLGVDIEASTIERVEFADSDREVVLLDDDPLVAGFDDQLFLTVRGANAYPPTRRTVTVDAGAVSFVSDGANVMRPGIVDADPDIDPGALVVVVEETHGKALAIGQAETDGDDMLGDEGMVVRSLHHVGDDLYQFDP